LAARKRESDSWWTETEQSPRSSKAHSSGPLLDTFPEESSGDRKGSDEAGREGGRHGSVERTEVIPSGNVTASEDRVEASRGRRPRPGVRRVKRSLRHIDPVSVLKLSLFYYACFLLLWLVFVALVYGVLASLGTFNAIDKIGNAFVLWKDVDISLWFVERWALLIGLTLAVVASLVNLFLAFLYNLAADVVGGAELTFVEREL
jgi:Transmembrane domain of unknown function (DUF3566)